MELKLDGVWRLKRWDPDAPMDEVFSPAFLPEGWLEVPVPGDVRTALSARGLIDGYYLGKALDQERWIDRSDWLYYLRFTPPSDKKGLPFLCFLGVDTLAEVWLNGQQLGACDNMFTPLVFSRIRCAETGRQHPGCSHSLHGPCSGRPRPHGALS